MCYIIQIILNFGKNNIQIQIIFKLFEFLLIIERYSYTIIRLKKAAKVPNFVVCVCVCVCVCV
jgi:hypothetical protein